VPKRALLYKGALYDPKNPPGDYRGGATHKKNRGTKKKGREKTSKKERTPPIGGPNSKVGPDLKSKILPMSPTPQLLPDGAPNR